MKMLYQPKQLKAESKGRIFYSALGVLLFVILVISGLGMPQVDADASDIRPGPRSLVSKDQLMGDRVVDMRGATPGAITRQKIRPVKIKTPDSEDEWSDSDVTHMTEHDRRML